MTTQPIADYLTKQIFIEKNIVTYRSLSRQFSIHVNVAKNELATYHHNAPYQSQTALATFLLSGTPRNHSRYKYEDEGDEDVNMDSTQASKAEEDDDGDEVPQTKITIVNERDLEDAKALYDEIDSIHVYSLSPAPLHDAGLLCAPTEFVRNTDKAKGPEFGSTVGRVVGRGIKMGTGKKRMQPPAPVAGPSKPKQPAAPEPKPIAKAETKEKLTIAFDKPKASGKVDFFKKPEKPKETKEIKKEEPVEDKKRMFFSKATLKAAPKVPSPAPSKPASPAPAPAPSVSNTKDEKAQPPRGVKRKSSIGLEPPAPVVPSAKAEKVHPTRGVKRKSSVGLESRERSPENPSVAKAESSTRVKRRVILSDDESDTPVTKAPPRKSRSSFKTESTENSEGEREAMALMDIDDDLVEKVSRVPSTNASSNEQDPDEDAESSVAQDEDVDMSDDTSSKPKTTKKRKPKMVIPVGRNGLKKIKTMKTRKTRDANGYLVREDYSEWESVASDAEPEPPAPPKTKPKAKATTPPVKKEDENPEIPPAPVKKEKEKEPGPKRAPVKSAAAGTKVKPAAKSAKPQKGLMNFFGPKKPAS